MTNLSRAIDLFCKEWPEGSEVTQDSLARADAIGLDLEWLALFGLPPQVYDELLAQRARLFADYRDKCAALPPDYLSKCAALYDDYEAGRAPLFASYEELSAPLYGDFLTKRAALYDDFLAKSAALLISALLNHFAAQTMAAAKEGN